MMRNIVAVLADFAAHVLPPLGKCAIALVFGLAIVPQGPSIRTDALRKRQKKTPALAGALFAARSDGYLVTESGIAEAASIRSAITRHCLPNAIAENKPDDHAYQVEFH